MCKNANNVYIYSVHHQYSDGMKVEWSPGTNQDYKKLSSQTVDPSPSLGAVQYRLVNIFAQFLGMKKGSKI